MNADILRQEIAASPSWVVKVGTRVLTRDDGTLNEDRIALLAEEISALHDAGRQVTLVSSGAVGAGMSQLGLKQRPTNVSQLQAVAAVGQAKLIETYDRTFRVHGRHAAQVLVTAADFNDRARYLNVRNTILALQQYGAVPVINENDTTSVEELTSTFGDNDRLAALVTTALQAPLLVILSDVEGLYDRDPADPGARVLPLVQELNESVFGLVRDKATGVSKGGMASKLEAARICSAAGENVIVASGRREGVLGELLAGKTTGTLFIAQGKSVSPWKRWIGFTVQPRGQLVLDAGACRAIHDDGRSLLAIGVSACQGVFEKGDAVSLLAADGKEVARGLINYSSAEMQRIKGLRSDLIPQVLGQTAYSEVIHRDNLAVLENQN